MPTTRRRIIVAANPRAAFGAHRESGAEVADLLRASGFDVDLLIESDAAALARSTALALDPRLPSSADVVALVVVGGDGMVALGIAAIGDDRVPLGIVPTGTGNDVARGLGLPLDDRRAVVARIVRALDERPRYVDAAEVTRDDGSTMRFAGVLSGGFDALVNERANTMTWPRGRARYTLAMVRELVALRPVEYEIDVDGVNSSRRGVLVAIANNSSFGGGMRVAPDASLDDGMLDVVMLAPVSRLALLRLFPKVFAGTHVADRRVSIERATRVRLSAERIVAYADGERVGPLPVVVEVRPQAWRVLA